MSPDFETLSRNLAIAWLRHLYTPAKGTVEAYVNARSALVYACFPEFLAHPVESRGDLPFLKAKIKPRAEAKAMLAKLLP